MLLFESQKYGHIDIEAFCVDKEYCKENVFHGKELLPLEDAVKKYPPSEYDMLSTVLASGNGLRAKMSVFNKLKKLGYNLANYISPLADIGQNVKMGENNIIRSFCVVGSEAKIGNANILWHNVILGYNINVGDGNFFAGGSKTAGFVSVGNSCWIGINSTIIQCINIADETLVGAGTVVIRNTNPCTTYVGNPARAISTHFDKGIIVDTTPPPSNWRQNKQLKSQYFCIFYQRRSKKNFICFDLRCSTCAEIFTTQFCEERRAA